jgi:hypothetical protein
MKTIPSVILCYEDKKFQLPQFVVTLEKELSGTFISTSSGCSILARISNPVIVLGPGLLKYELALTA